MLLATTIVNAIANTTLQLSIGTLIGALLAGPLADRIGRKWSIFAWCIILHVGLIIQITSPSGKWYQIMMGRFVTGFGVGACSLLVPMYQGEIAPRHIRGAMVWYVPFLFLLVIQSRVG